METAHTGKFLETVEKSIPDPSTKTDPQAALHAVYSAIIQSDFATLAELVAEDVELHISGSGVFDGSWRGRADMVAGTRRNFGLVTGQKPEIEGIVADGEQVAVLMRETGVVRETGKPYHIRCVQWCRFEGGKLKRVDQVVAPLPV